MGRYLWRLPVDGIAVHRASQAKTLGGGCARYLENKQEYLDYAAFLTAGWPVGSSLSEAR